MAPPTGGAPLRPTLLDEAMGVAARRGVEETELDIVTVDFKLRYRRPAPTGTLVRVRGEPIRRDGRDFYMEGAIESGDGDVLVLAEARWRQIDRR